MKQINSTYRMNTYTPVRYRYIRISYKKVHSSPECQNKTRIQPYYVGNSTENRHSHIQTDRRESCWSDDIIWTWADDIWQMKQMRRKTVEFLRIESSNQCVRYLCWWIKPLNCKASQESAFTSRYMYWKKSIIRRVKRSISTFKIIPESARP